LGDPTIPRRLQINTIGTPLKAEGGTTCGFFLGPQQLQLLNNNNVDEIVPTPHRLLSFLDPHLLRQFVLFSEP
jgi:hypothetical protein